MLRIITMTQNEIEQRAITKYDSKLKPKSELDIFFPEKGLLSEKTVLVANDGIITDEHETANNFNPPFT